MLLRLRTLWYGHSSPLSFSKYNYLIAPIQCDNNCSYPNGQCVNGLCLCSVNWTGINCDQGNCIHLQHHITKLILESENIVVTLDATSPSIYVVPATNALDGFHIYGWELREVTFDGYVVDSLFLEEKFAVENILHPPHVNWAFLQPHRYNKFNHYMEISKHTFKQCSYPIVCER